MTAGPQEPPPVARPIGDPEGSLLIVGYDGGSHVGGSLFRAAGTLGLTAQLLDAQRAFDAPKLVARINWWLRGRRPTRLRAFSERVVEAARGLRPKWLIATGLAPIERRALDAVRATGAEAINYLTDDPWNPALSSRWMLDALPGYTRIASVRRSNMKDLARLGCKVDYVPFGFDPDLFFPPKRATAPAGDASDVLFAGNADRDRVPYIAALIDAGLSVELYGLYWDRFAATRRWARGRATPETLRRAIATSAVSLCLVRRANRDGHAMRTFEIPAAGGCALVEDTPEHRDLFGRDGSAVVYFGSIREMAARAAALVRDPARRHTLARRAQQLVWNGACTYRHRLRTLLQLDRASHEDRSRRSGPFSRV